MPYRHRHCRTGFSRDRFNGVSPPRLYDRHADGQPPGDRWLVADDFASPRVARALEPFLGPPDAARFRFADHTVEFFRGSKPNSVSARVVPN